MWFRCLAEEAERGEQPMKLRHFIGSLKKRARTYYRFAR
jgi:hypothetical protein